MGYSMVMGNLIDVAIPVDVETAKALEDPARRAAAGRYLSHLLRGGRLSASLAQAITDVKQQAHTNGLTDEMVDAELEAWQAERHA